MLYGVNQRLQGEDVESPLTQVRPVKTVLLVAIAGSRGLCGGYNAQVIKQVRKVMLLLRVVSGQSQLRVGFVKVWFCFFAEAFILGYLAEITKP